MVWTETIEDVKFTYYDSGRIYIYYNGLIYTLTEAYEVGVLTLEDLANLLSCSNNLCSTLISLSNTCPLIIKNFIIN